MRTVLIVGEFGRHDPGAEAVLEASIRSLDGYRVVASSARPEATRVAHACESVYSDDVLALARALTGCDALLIAGPTLSDAGSPLSHALLLVAARVMRKRTAVLGAGVGRLDSSVAGLAARLIDRRSELLVLREESSARVLAGLGVRGPFRVGADPSWMVLDEAAARYAEGNGHVVAVIEDSLGERGREVLRGSLAAVERGGARIELMPWRPEDRMAVASLRRDLHGHVGLMPAPSDLPAAQDALGDAAAVIVAAPHPLIASSAAGTACVALSSDPALTGLAARLRQPSVSLDEGPERLSDAVRTALDAEGLEPGLAKAERRRAEASFRLLRVLLSEGRSGETDEVDGLPMEPQP